MAQRVLRGTVDANGVKTFKQPEGGTGRLRCPKCQGLATAKRLASGQQVMQCASCGTNYTVTAMGAKPAVDPPYRVGVPRPKRIPR